MTATVSASKALHGGRDVIQAAVHRHARDLIAFAVGCATQAPTTVSPWYRSRRSSLTRSATADSWPTATTLSMQRPSCRAACAVACASSTWRTRSNTVTLGKAMTT